MRNCSKGSRHEEGRELVMWRSENDLQELVLPLYRVGPRIGSKNLPLLSHLTNPPLYFPDRASY